MKAQYNQDRTDAFWSRYRRALAAREIQGREAECFKQARSGSQEPG